MYACTSVRWVMDRLCAHALAGSCCGLGLKPETLKPCEPLPVGVDRVRLRRAGVLLGVCFQRGHRRVEHRGRVRHGLGMRLFGPAARTMADALGRASMRRGGLLRGGTADAHARVRTRAGTRLRGGLGVGTAGRRGGSTHASEYIHVDVRVLYTLTHTLSISSVCVRIGRGDACVHHCAMGDGSAVCAHDGGLVLRARPTTRNPKIVRALARRRGPRAASARRRSNRRLLSTRTSARGTPRPSPRCTWYAPFRPGGAHYGGRARPGFGAARPVVRGGPADARAHTCRHSLARGLRCRHGRAEGRFDTCIRIHIHIHVY